jgi:phosphatidylserine decarboxylase
MFKKTFIIEIPPSCAVKLTSPIPYAIFSQFFMRNQGFIIAREGIKWLISGFLITLFFFLVKLPALSLIFLGLTLFTAFFFRNPKRDIPNQPGIVLSPADGKICMITEAYEKRFLKEKRKRISIFMSVFNCHLNRSPVEAKVIDTHYHQGKFHLANVDKASDLNEQLMILLEDQTTPGDRYVVVQIAGYLARRIVSYVKSGDILKRGELFGIIQFGSRVDLYLPENVNLKVTVGDSVYGGETVLGVIK